MTRLLEIIVALIIVVVLAVVVGVLLPSHGHVERSIDISHNVRHTFDSVDSFRRFPDYSALASLDPNVRFELSGPDYGKGSKVSWSGGTKVDDGSLTITSSDTDRQVVWDLDSDWRGSNKHYTINLEPSDNQKLVHINMSYDVDYGWNLLDRYSQLYLHGEPATFMQYTLSSLQSMLANIPNIGYKDLDPVLVNTEEQPVLMVSTRAPRNLDDIAVATNKALEQIHDAMKKLGVKQDGKYVTLTTDWGDQNYTFDVAVPIDSSVLKINGRDIDLHDAPKAKSFAEQNLESATDEPAKTASAEGPAKAGSSNAPSKPTEGPGTFDDDGTLIVNNDVHAKLAFGGRALMAHWHGSPAGLELMRLALKAYASTHGYDFNEYSDRLYDVMLSDPDKTAEDDRDFRVYLPVTNAPDATPFQKEHPQEAEQVISGSSAPSPASSVAPASSTAPASSS